GGAADRVHQLVEDLNDVVPLRSRGRTDGDIRPHELWSIHPRSATFAQNMTSLARRFQLLQSAAEARSTGALEVLDRSLVSLRGRTRRECAEVPSLARARILLSRIEAVATGSELADHAMLLP